MKKNKLTIALFSMFAILLGLTIYTGLGVMADESEVLLKKTTLVYDENSGIVIDNGDITFNDKNQTVSYKLLLENTQDYDVKISDIKLSTPTEEFLEFEVENNIDIIESNSTKELVLSLETTGIKGWGKNFNDKLTANISFEKVEKPVVEEPLPEAPATNTEELISQTKEIEIKNITKDTIEFTEDFKVEKGEKVAVWIYSEPTFLGYFDVIEENGIKKIEGLEEALEKANIKSGDHTIAITTEEETIGYICVYIDEEKEILKENPSPDVSNKDENIVEEEIENVVPNPNTSDKELIVILGLLTSITGMLVIVVSRNKISRYAVLVILLGTTITTTNAEKLIDIPLTINVNFKSQNVMIPSGCEYNSADKTIINCNSYWKHREKIKNIHIQNEIIEIKDYVEKFNVTEKEENKRVTAYLVTNKEDSNYYDLYLQTDGILYFNKDASFYFGHMKNLDKIVNIEGVDTSNIENMYGMFSHAGFYSDSFNLDLSSFNTSNVTNMGSMFIRVGHDSSHVVLDISNFDTSKVKSMRYMFYQTGFKSKDFTLDVTPLDTSNVTDMSYMFYETGYSSSSITLDISSFDTKNATNMDSMFQSAGYSNPNFTLDVSKLDTSKVTTMSNMFYQTGYNSTVIELDLTKFNTSNVTDMSYMFYGTGYNNPKFILDLTKFNTSNVKNMRRMFFRTGYNSEILTIDVSKFNTSQVTNMSDMFYETGKYAKNFTIDVSNFDTSNVTDMSNIFFDAGHASTNFALDVSNFNTSNVTNMSNMFKGTGYSSPNFTIDVSGFDTSKVTNMRYMFYATGYSNDNFALDVSNFNTSKVTDMSYMFYKTGYNSSNFKLNLSNFNTSNVTDMSYMFYETARSSDKISLDLSKWDTSKVTDMSYMFYKVGYNNSDFNLDLNNFDTSKVTSMSYMFYGAGYNSTKFVLDITNFNTSNVTNMAYMFSRSGYKSDEFILKINGFDISNVSTIKNVFYETAYENNTNLSITLKINNNKINFIEKLMSSNISDQRGIKIKFNYTSKTTDIIDNVIQKFSYNNHVVKGEYEVDLKNIDVGDVIIIDNEYFYVISQTNDKLSMLSKYNLSNSYRQSATSNYVKFSSSNGWEYTPGPKEIDIQTWSTNPKTYVNKYVSYLKEVTGDTNLVGDLITLNQLKELGCKIPTDYGLPDISLRKCSTSPYKSWLYELGQSWWTKSANSTDSSKVFRLMSNGNLTAPEYNDAGKDNGVRPVITISKETLKNLN